MKYFKKETTRTATRYPITSKTFEEVTEHKYPFEVKNIDGTISQYGICPSCLNPIQLIGIARKIKVSPYGKHTGKTIKGLATWNQVKYEYCPYATKIEQRKLRDEEILLEITEDVIELYNLLRNNFDRVVYIISKELDIRCSTNLWKNALKQYLVNYAYCYPWLTESNLPYIFAYRGMTHNSIYGQQVRINSDLFIALKKHKYIKFDIPKNSNGEYKIISSQNGFLNLEFRFTEHKQRAIEGEELIETMKFFIDDLENGKTIFQKNIKFNESFFMNIIKKYGDSNNRQQYLLDIAKQYMSPLKVN